MNEWIDISVPIFNGMVHWPNDQAFHREEMMRIDQGDVCNLSRLTTTAHLGTHMDAPRHFLRDGAGIDSMPIDATVGPARVIRIDDPDLIRIDELERHHIAPGERILFRTRNSETVWKTDDFQKSFVHIPPATARYLASTGVRAIGVDYLSVGAFEGEGGVETHRALLGAGIWIIEGLNLASIDPGDYDLICLPLKIEGGDGSPARAVLRRRP